MLILLAACALVDPCLRPLEQWCWGEAEEGPVCDEITLDEVSPSYRCGDWDVSTTGPNFTGTNLYFDHESGELVAAAEWSDVAVNDTCADWSLWSGRRIECDPTCSYTGDEDLPACE